MIRSRRRQLPQHPGSRRKMVVVVFVVATYAVVHVPGSGAVWVMVVKQASREISAMVRGTDASPQVRVAATTAGIRN